MSTEISHNADAPLDLEDAHQLLQSLVKRLECEDIELSEACGRITASETRARHAVPQHDVSAMDGYAVAALSDPAHKNWALLGQSLAGHPYAHALEIDQAIYITTGAHVPPQTVRVLQKEICSASEQRLLQNSKAEADDYIRRRGSDSQAQDLLCRQNQPLNARDIACLAADGRSKIRVYRQARVAVFSSGDELGQDTGTFDCNRPMLLALFRSLGCQCTDLGQLPDDLDAIKQRLGALHGDYDLVLSSGGVSVGSKDFLRPALQALGTVHAHKMRLKPGKPMTIAQLGDGLFFALPGNPVSAYVMSLILVVPTLRAMHGGRLALPSPVLKPLTAPLTHQPGRAEFQRVSLDGEGIRPSGAQDSHLLSVLQAADGLCFVARNATGHDVGERCPYYDFDRLKAIADAR